MYIFYRYLLPPPYPGATTVFYFLEQIFYKAFKSTFMVSVGYYPYFRNYWSFKGYRFLALRVNPPPLGQICYYKTINENFEMLLTTITWI